MQERDTTHKAGLRVSEAEARSIAGLLRYAISLNTTAGLLSPGERRLATPTYRAAELAALVLEGKTFDEALKGAAQTWTGSLEHDHRHALEMLSTHREVLRKAMSGRLTPEQIAEYLEVSGEQFLELARAGLSSPVDNQH
ncbi:MAG TPA: hypothetical protein VHM16_05830 [Rubrobacteraceae bacterium]|nr:hypothetical protein [Rubrobacteraceae bacterium]